ncbi:hypothetical protein BY458DRAFT_526691 [Sporodiniella umbellata]|nr:hypothetical protein BY458DRAFT_526691 [Sporodiniella umbellata]
MDPYKILDIKSNCTKEELKKRYKELAKLYHPDNNQTGDLKRFHQVSQAYTSLTSAQTPSTLRYHHYPEDPIYYRTQFTQRYAKNSTFMSILAGCVVLVGAFHVYYIQNSHSSFIQAANRHHLQSSGDLKKARTEAKLFGNERGIHRVLNHRLKAFRKEED